VSDVGVVRDLVFEVNNEPHRYYVSEGCDLTVTFCHAATFREGRQIRQYETLVKVLRIKKNSADITVDGVPQRVALGTKIVIPHTTTFIGDVGTAVVTKPTTIVVVAGVS
jgi:hypothetical protein